MSARKSSLGLGTSMGTGTGWWEYWVAGFRIRRLWNSQLSSQDCSGVTSSRQLAGRSREQPEAAEPGLEPGLEPSPSGSEPAEPLRTSGTAPSRSGSASESSDSQEDQSAAG